MVDQNRTQFGFQAVLTCGLVWSCRNNSNIRSIFYEQIYASRHLNVHLIFHYILRNLNNSKTIQLLSLLYAARHLLSVVMIYPWQPTTLSQHMVVCLYSPNLFLTNAYDQTLKCGTLTFGFQERKSLITQFNILVLILLS